MAAADRTPRAPLKVGERVGVLYRRRGGGTVLGYAVISKVTATSSGRWRYECWRTDDDGHLVIDDGIYSPDFVLHRADMLPTTLQTWEPHWTRIEKAMADGFRPPRVLKGNK